MLDRGPALVPSLYVHVPFCGKKCAYCAFYSAPAAPELIQRYVDTLIRELAETAPLLRPRTIFFGGGTPSLLTVRQWDSILDALNRLGLAGAAEFTIECNPATLSTEKARRLRDGGVNRVSMGVQSFDDQLLERLGRIHSRQKVFDSFDLLRKAGFDNINLDLMFGIPGQSLDQWRQTLREAIGLGSEHLSTYEVIYEEDTPFFERLQSGTFCINEDLACAMYEELLGQADAAGFHQYEVANFARHAAGARREPPLSLPSCACLHNVNYWRGGQFIGLGPSAASYVGGVRTKRCPDTRAYCERVAAGESTIDFHEELSPLGRAGEIAAFGLRMTAGWPFEQFSSVTGFDLRHEWTGELRELTRQGWADVTSDRVRLTKQGLRFADSAAQLFLR